MELNIEINNKADSPIAEDFFVAVAEKTIQASGYDFLKEKKIEISVALVPEEEMQKINRESRQKDSVTDVLSFFEYGSMEEIKNISEKEIFLGELIMCYDDIVKYALREGIEPEDELTSVFSHGVLHLLGFSHGEKMFAIQKEIVVG